jgi:hypothetical protein
LDETTKKCSICGEVKLLSEYYKRNDCLYGVYSRCKACVSEVQKGSREKINATNKARRLRDPEGEKLKLNRSRDKTKGKDRERTKLWREANPDAVAKQASQWAKDHPEESRAIKAKHKKKLLSTAKGKLEANVRRGIRRGLVVGSKAGRRTFELLGYTSDELKTHIEKQFTVGMSWENYGEWHIDHKMPLAAHDYETPDCQGFKLAWALSNLQPLWGKENMSKGAKILEQHLPAASANDNHHATTLPASKLCG